MMSLAKALLIVATVMSPVISFSQSKISVLSFEDPSCGVWAKSTGDNSRRQVYEYWFRGFVSGYNLGNPDNQVHF